MTSLPSQSPPGVEIGHNVKKETPNNSCYEVKIQLLDQIAGIIGSPFVENVDGHLR
jgi:hypothetical protein